jgi:CrcB protein
MRDDTSAGTSAAHPTGGAHRYAPHGIGHALGADDLLPIDPDLDPEDPGEPSRAHRAGGRPHRLHPGVLAAIVAGGFLGTLGRYEVGVAWPTRSGHFPTAIFVINTTGAFLLGLVLTMLLERRPVDRFTHFARPFAATGVLGGWTTYSSLAVGAVTLAKGGDVAVGAGYLSATLVCGVSAVACGIALGRTRTGAPAPAPAPADGQ